MLPASRQLSHKAMIFVQLQQNHGPPPDLSAALSDATHSRHHRNPRQPVGMPKQMSGARAMRGGHVRVRWGVVTANRFGP
jgi:hypothetical protein